MILYPKDYLKNHVASSVSTELVDPEEVKSDIKDLVLDAPQYYGDINNSIRKLYPTLSSDQIHSLIQEVDSELRAEEAVENPPIKLGKELP